MDATGRLRKGTYCSRVFTLATSLPPSRLSSPQAAYKGGAAVPLPAEFLSEVETMMAEHEVPGLSLSVIHNYEVVETAQLGVLVKGEEKKVDKLTRFQVFPA